MTFLISVTDTEVVKTVSSLLLWLGKPCRIMTFLFPVEIDDMTQVLAKCADNVGIEPELFQARYQLLEDAPTRSSLCHRVPRYQALPDTLNRNYEARVTFPTPLHHSGGQVEAVVYHRDLDWGLIEPFLGRQRVCLDYPE